MNYLNLFLISTIPLLFSIFLYYAYNFYKVKNSQVLMMDILKNENSKIIDNTKNEINIDYKNNFLEKKLLYAGFESDSSVNVFIFISLTTGFLVALFIFYIIESFLALGVAVLIFSCIPYLVLIKIISSREEEFNLFLKEIIDKVTSMMKSGVGFEQAFKKSILTTHSEFTKKVFSIYIKEKDIIGEKEAFEKMFKYVNSRELRIFYLTISIGRQSGGKFSNTLEKLRKTLQDQGEIKQQITSATREVKIGSYMILALLVFIFVLMNNSLDGILYEHFFYSNIGRLQMFFLLLWVAFGLFINNLLTKIK